MTKLELEPSWTRRQFLKSSAITVGGAAAFPDIITSSALGARNRARASERITMGVIGMGRRAERVTGAFLEEPDAQVVAVCDVSAERREIGRRQINDKYGNQNCRTYIDMLEMLDRPDIDAVLIATGDNWHSGVPNSWVVGIGNRPDKITAYIYRNICLFLFHKREDICPTNYIGNEQHQKNHQGNHKHIGSSCRHLLEFFV